jgi:ABC-type nickel/cobalt efflux system permease component RcnA
MTRLLQLLVITLALTVGSYAGLAQTTSAPATGQPAQRSFLPPATQQPPQAAPSGPLQQAYLWLMAKQSEINQRLAAAVRDIRTGNPVLATLILAGLSFAYGVLHAAGPGHGKAVISSYVLANERTMRRGIALSFLAAFIQGLSALLIVAVLVLGLKATGLTMKTTERWLETLSWGFVAAVGAWLLWRQIASLRQRHELAPATEHAHHHGHDHHHDHNCGHDHHQHDHHHHHDHAHGDACCSHAHMPDPKQLEGAWSWRKMLPIAFAVGIRPCTGAILVLVFAIGQGLAWAGVFATFAMAIGTAITVSALAALAVGSRELAARLGNSGGIGAERVRTIAGLGGSAAVLALGLFLFVGSLTGGTAF